MELHTYQKNCLKELSAFFAAVAERGRSPQQAFAAMRNRPYFPPPFLPESMPYVCIRIPTGGGKTLLAAHAAGRTARKYLNTKTPTILWLAPTGTIVSQTLKLLKDERHPCHLALVKYFGGVNCISVADALRVNKHDMDEAATVIVATVQSLRRSETAKLKIYDDNGALMPHFDSLPDELRDKLVQEDGKFFSLANVIRLRRPIVVSDEAHNSGTSLSFKSLERFAPSCILEFTATPQTKNQPAKKKYASNVLSQASARELQNANMIKFPLNFEVHSDWRENIRAAVAKRDKLERAAKKEGNHIRPIVLYQAENADETATAEVVKQALLDFKVSAEEIAVHTGTTRELQKQANTDLFSRQCPIRHIITVRALAEGWDCSFAYVLCTMANLQSPKAVEQILGRILRLPGARRQSQKSLNECYAFASKGNVAEVAKNLKDTLVKKSGFQIMEAADFINLPDDCPLLPGFGRPTPAPTQRGMSIVVPLLAVRESGVLDLLERAHFLGTKWSIAKAKPDMSDFSPPTIAVDRGVIFVREDGKVQVKPGGEGNSPDSADAIHGQLMLLEADKKWTVATLAAELDADIDHPDIPQTESAPFILAAVNQLAKKHTIPQLARWLPYIKKRLESDIDKLRREQIEKGWQQMLLTKTVEGGRLEVSAEHAVSFERRRYAPHWLCPDADMLNKHLFPGEVGELKGGGEEWNCACFLNSMPEVKVWVRNLEKRDNSFWLQTSSDKFYPDFVCRLTDGRIMAVEYKGSDRWGNPDSTEKRNLGEMWAQLGGDKCLFVMPKGQKWSEIEKCVRGE